MKTILTILACCCLATIVLAAKEHQDSSRLIRRKRQAATSTSLAMASAVSSDSTTRRVETGTERPPLGPVNNPNDRFNTGTSRDEEADTQAAARPKPTRKAKKRPPVVRYSEEDCEEEADYEDQVDYDNNTRRRGSFFPMEPIHNMRRFMDDMFDRMNQFGATGPYGDGNSAMASAYSDGDGYSRIRSSVSNRGRTNGIVSETRNGRTQTRRFGDNDDDGDEQQ